jgi:hypothetical protein
MRLLRGEAVAPSYSGRSPLVLDLTSCLTKEKVPIDGPLLDERRGGVQSVHETELTKNAVLEPTLTTLPCWPCCLPRSIRHLLPSIASLTNTD